MLPVPPIDPTSPNPTVTAAPTIWSQDDGPRGWANRSVTSRCSGQFGGQFHRRKNESWWCRGHDMLLRLVASHQESKSVFPSSERVSYSPRNIQVKFHERRNELQWHRGLKNLLLDMILPSSRRQLKLHSSKWLWEFQVLGGIPIGNENKKTERGFLWHI